MGGPPPGMGGPPPGPGAPPNGPGWTQPEWVGAGGQPPRRRRRGVLFGAIGAAFAIVLGGGAFAAYQYLSGGGPQPAEALPSNTIAYLRIDLDPSASQKVNAIRLLRRVPEFEDATGISSDTDDLRELMFDAMVEDSDCDLSYEDDIKPWIGDRAGLAAVPVDDRVVTVAAVQVSDQQAAKDAVDAIKECGVSASAFDSGAVAGDVDVASGGAGGLLASSDVVTADDESVDVDFVGDYMLIADDPDALPDIVSDAESSPLSDSGQFQADMDALDGEGFASYWVNVDGFRDAAESMGGVPPGQFGMEGAHTTFGAVRAGSDNIEFVMQTTSDADISADVDNPISELPDTTLMAASASGGAELIDNYWGDVQSMIENFGGPDAYADMLSTVETETSLRLPDDLRTILGDNITLAMDSTGLTPENFGSEDPADFYFGARLTTDQAAIQEVVDRLNAKLASEGMSGTLITQETDDGLVVASNDDYAGMLASGGDLGSSDGFETALPDGSGSTVAFYLDFDRLTDAIAQDESADQDLVETLEPMRSLGSSLAQVDGGQRWTTRLVFD
jgi:hypothetical protein